MSDRILIGTGQATNQKGDIINIKIFLGNVVELPDGSQTSLSEEQYALVLEQWNREQVKIEGASDKENAAPAKDVADTPEETEAITEEKKEEENNSSRPINIQYFDEKSGTLSDNPPEPASIPAKEEVKEEPIPQEPNEKPLAEPVIADKKTDKSKKNNKLVNLFIGIFIIILLFLLYYFISPSLDILNSPSNSIEPSIEPSPIIAAEKTILRATQDIVQGDTFTEEMIASYTISDEEFNQMNDATYVSTDGTTTNSSLLTSENASDIIGKFATRNIPKGTYLTLQDYSSQKVIAEKTFIEVDIDGRTVSVPVDNAALAGNTRVKIVALITTDNQEDTIAIALSEFILEDRTLSDIFDSAGQSILDQLAGQSSGETE